MIECRVMRGKDINMTVLAGVEHVREIKAYTEDGKEWAIEGIGVSGSLWDARGEKYLGELECKVTEEGRIEVKYPSMGEGRYIFAVDGVSDTGEVERIIEGYIVYSGPLAIEEGESGDYLSVYIGKERRKVLFGKNSAWEIKYKETEKAVIEADGAANRAKESEVRALQALQEAITFMNSFNEAVQKVIRIGKNGNWEVGGKDTGMPAQGKDGESPSIGADGLWYVGGKSTGVAARGENGLTPSIGEDGTWVIGGENTGVAAQGRDGLNGTAVRRILVKAYEEIPQEGSTCNGGYYYYVPNAEKTYDVYAWLEPDGWVRVDMVYDIATENVYGLVKLGTSMPVYEGAPVGVKEDGGLGVPVAGIGLTGVGRLSTDEQQYAETSGEIGMDSDLRFRVVSATAFRYGAVKLSFESEDCCSVIGLTPEGAAGVAKADSIGFGVVKIGEMADGVPSGYYSATVRESANEQLHVPLLQGGALQYRSRFSLSDYEQSMEWLGESFSTIDYDWTYPCYGLGLMTSSSFYQSEEFGLELVQGSEDRLGGVYVTGDITDERSGCVLSVQGVSGELEQLRGEMAQFALKTEVVSIDRLNAEVENILETTALKSEVENMVNDVRDEFYSKSDSDNRFVRGADNARKLYVMSKADFDSLLTREEDAIYFVKR